MLLRLRTYDNRHHAGRPIHQWLLEQGRELGFSGGLAFRAMAGFGRDGRMHEQRFFELAGEEPVVVELIGDAAQVERILRRIDDAGLALPWWQVPVEHGVGLPA
ncbi:DUF190 domain-containing protein [Lysobacter spongiae]|uniref:DUF190 domain-containing protein n=1 Tax=Marilutibacter spongiae TaxID=2025720 RepID=A0A7W3TJ78_9GAMM|nr:DUF190 domain-containing protein [Lysobacter spongiae]